MVGSNHVSHDTKHDLQELIHDSEELLYDEVGKGVMVHGTRFQAVKVNSGACIGKTLLLRENKKLLTIDFGRIAGYAYLGTQYIHHIVPGNNDTWKIILSDDTEISLPVQGISQLLGIPNDAKRRLQ